MAQLFEQYLVLTDLDGTVVDEALNILPRDIEAISYFIANGGTFGVSTGRVMVSAMTKEAAGGLYDAMTGENVEVAQTRKALDRFVKLLAVQKFSPSQSLAVFSLMKPIMREHVMPELMAQNDLAAYLETESRIDSLTLLAFDMYMEDREVLAESRITEIRNQHAQLARWAQQLESGAVPSGDDR